jgi:hypothetical protein
VKRTLQEHLDWLKAREKDLCAELMAAPTQESANHFDSELRTVRLAIEHYKAAYNLEEALLSGKSDRT